jgi:hypothetical protein
MPNRPNQERRPAMPALTTRCHCEYCGIHRAQGNHTKCSKRRQADRRTL